MTTTVPVALFAYARPSHLKKTLECLRANDVPLIYAFSDGPRTLQVKPHVIKVRDILRAIDWSEVVVCERDENFGLGRSIRTGVSEVLMRHDSVIVFEDDLICVQGTYKYLSHALQHYADDPKVMSVTGWTHPRVTPSNVMNQPYFDGRAECWVWGTWARAWVGMNEDARSLMMKCTKRGIDVRRYGADLPGMADVEIAKNIWAVRWLYLHILHGGLAFRPPYSMVEHIGFDSLATNASDGSEWSNPPLGPCPPLPDHWPASLENPECPVLWQSAYQYSDQLGMLAKVRKMVSTLFGRFRQAKS
jgi:hypothetical protein